MSDDRITPVPGGVVPWDRWQDSQIRVALILAGLALLVAVGAVGLGLRHAPLASSLTCPSCPSCPVAPACPAPPACAACPLCPTCPSPPERHRPRATEQP